MKKVFSLLCLLALITQLSYASAANWQNIGQDVEGYHWSIDTESLLIDESGHCTITFKKVHPQKKFWFQGELSIIPMRRLYSLNRWEEHKKGKSKYTYWTYDYKLKSYSTNTMYDYIGKTIIDLQR